MGRQKLHQSGLSRSELSRYVEDSCSFSKPLIGMRVSASAWLGTFNHSCRSALTSELTEDLRSACKLSSFVVKQSPQSFLQLGSGRVVWAPIYITKMLNFIVRWDEGKWGLTCPESLAVRLTDADIPSIYPTIDAFPFHAVCQWKLPAKPHVSISGRLEYSSE